VDFVLDAATVAAFERTNLLDQLRLAAKPHFVIVDVVHVELTSGGTQHHTVIADAIAAGWLRVEALPASLASRISALMSDKKLGRKVDAGEAASVAFCAEHPATTFVTPDCGGFFAALKHLYGTQTRALSFHGFLRHLSDTHGLPPAKVRALIHYADQGGSLKPLWWDDWLRAVPTT